MRSCAPGGATHAAATAASGTHPSGDHRSNLSGIKTLDASSPIKRLAAGDRELARPSSGLSLAQRRLLTQLGTPASLAELAARGNLEPQKLERDLARLTEIGLVDAGGAALPPPRELQSRSPANESFAAPRRGIGVAVAVGAAVSGLAAATWLGWTMLSSAASAGLRWPSSPAVIASGPSHPKTPISAVTACRHGWGDNTTTRPASAAPPAVAAALDAESVADRTDGAASRSLKTASSRSTPGIANARATANATRHEPGVRTASRESPSDSPQREVLPSHLATTQLTHIRPHPPRLAARPDTRVAALAPDPPAARRPLRRGRSKQSAQASLPL